MIKFTKFVEDIINEHIVNKNGKWLVTNKSKTKILGTHDTKEDAIKQLSAIEISKIHS